MNNIDNKISLAFKDKKALVAFITGGDPSVDITEKLIYALCEGGADVIEIGIPFSDPVAEGIVIQEADARALAAGCTVDKLFSVVKRARKKVSIPLLFMTYVNPIFTYGKKKFMENCKDSGIDGVIVPDLPFEEKGELEGVCKEYGITLISMIAPTSGERIEKIAREAQGFLYCVSSLGVTGVRSNITTDVSSLINAAKKVSNVPCAIGFGISSPSQAKAMAKIADGVIVGRAIVKIVAEHGKNCLEPVKQFIREIAAYKSN